MLCAEWSITGFRVSVALKLHDVRLDVWREQLFELRELSRAPQSAAEQYYIHRVSHSCGSVPQHEGSKQTVP
jgi:hypothetical protein